MRIIDFTDGFESTSAPSGGSLLPLDYLDLNESTIPAAPAALDRRIWVDSSGILQVENSLAANLVQVNTTSSQTLTNKTLSGNIALSLIGGSSAVITLPSATGTLATLSGTETFTNKTFVDVNFVIGDDIDATKKLKWELSSITAATTRTWTVPDVSDTLVGLVSTQTITGKTLTGNIALNLVGGSASVVTLPSVTGTLATLANAETLTNKTLTGNIAVNLLSGAATITLPVVTGTLATLAGTEVLTNKTLTGNTAVNLLSGAAVITLPVVTGTLATLAGTEVLTNKDIDGGTASNSLRITLPKNTLANLNALNRKEGTLVYASDTNALYADNGATLDLISSSSTSFNGFKNRIINGGMDIDQRNEGASLNNPVSSRLFSVDRFSINGTSASKFKATRTPSAIETGYAVRVAAGFPNYLELESLSAYSLGANEYYFLEQVITSNNFSDMAFGTASAQTVTLSFLVNSSLTGNFGGALINEASNRSYPFSYTVNSANTWETKTITIAGDTTGTWVITSTNGVGAAVRFSMGASGTYTGTVNTWGTANAMGPSSGITQHVNTSGAKLRITGVQLEKGSSATAFDFLSWQRKFELCEYYYQKTYDQTVPVATNTGATSVWFSVSINNTDFYDFGNVTFKKTMRTTATIVTYSTDGAPGQLRNLSLSTNQGNSGVSSQSAQGFHLFCTNSSMSSSNAFATHYTADAEH